MLSSTFSLAPAGVLGSGSVDARPYACVAVRPSLLPTVGVVEGIRVPSAVMGRRRGADLPAGIAPTFGATALSTTEQHDPIAHNDGTTPLGIHPRGRSTS
jgi:hypothetical protein